MKKQLLILFSVLLSVLALNVQSQDTIRSLIFSEWAGINRYKNYIELTNVGEDTVDLADFTLMCSNGGQQFVDDGGEIKFKAPVKYHLRLSGKLAPDSSYLLMNVFDGLRNDGFTYHKMEMLEIADVIVHYDNVLENVPTIVDPERELWGFDSLSVHQFLMRLLGGLSGNALFYHLPGGDSVMVDAVNLNLDAGLKVTSTQSDVAGIYDATGSHILVRKKNITSGNTDWETARGIDAEDSEWMPIPYFMGGGTYGGNKIYTTVRTHGDFGIDISSETIGINLNDSTMAVPWGTYKGESIRDEFTLGNGIGWQYIQDTTSVEDSTHVIAQTGDILQIFATGDDLEWIDFNITTLPPADSIAKVFPLSYKYYPDPVSNDYYWTTPYYVTDGEPVIDTIGNVPFSTRKDSLLKYLEIAPDASWEIVWVDEMARIDLKRGDILQVTAKDGTIKEYYIDVLNYFASDNALLSAITWPDKKGFIEGWKEDTIAQFNPNKTSYKLILPPGAVSIPAFDAIPMDINASVTQKRAVNLTGSLEDRSTVFTVTAEDDSTTKKYTVTFELEKLDMNIQKFYGDPFISEMVLAQWGTLGYVEIVNPRNVPLDLSEYLFVNSASINPGEALEGVVPDVPTDVDFKFRYRGYVPGTTFYDDTLGWLLNPGKLVPDITVDPVLEPGDVFVCLTAGAGRDQWARDRTPEVWANIDKVWGSTVDMSGISLYNTFSAVKRNAEAVYVFRIMSDSVLDGTKGISDPLDFELVDVFGDLVEDEYWDVAGHYIKKVAYKVRIARKPYIYKGVTEVGVGLGTTADSSDWIVEKNPEDIANQQHLNTYIGSHSMDVVTVYMSTISSLPYLVSDGYSSTPPQTIQGDMASTTLSDFYGNIQEADTGQAFRMISGTTGLELDLADPVGGNDTLVVTSSDSSNVTRYVLVDEPLDDNALLIVKSAYTGSYTVNVDGADGTITGSGVRWGVPVKEIMAALIFPDLATYSIIDKENKLVPLQVRNFDGVLSDVRINDSIFIEVRAQDGSTIITYQLKPESDQSDAFVVSSIFLVD